MRDLKPNRNIKINYAGTNWIEISRDLLFIAGREVHKMSYTDAIRMGLIEGNKEGWRLPTIKEWKFLSPLGELGIISFPGFYYLTSETSDEYIPEKIRDEDDEIQKTLSEDPFAFDDSVMDQIYVWDVRENEEWLQYDGDTYDYILIRDIR